MLQTQRNNITITSILATIFAILCEIDFVRIFIFNVKSFNTREISLFYCIYSFVFFVLILAIYLLVLKRKLKGYNFAIIIPINFISQVIYNIVFMIVYSQNLSTYYSNLNFEDLFLFNIGYIVLLLFYSALALLGFVSNKIKKTGIIIAEIVLLILFVLYLLATNIGYAENQNTDIDWLSHTYSYAFLILPLVIYIFELKSLSAKNKITNVTQTINSISPAKQNNDNNSSIEYLRELKELLDTGAITQEEFDEKKKDLLNL